MYYYKKINDINNFDSIFSCLNNLCSCSMGLLFPKCLFGRIYEISELGECYVGFCNIYLLHFLSNLLISFIFLMKPTSVFINYNFGDFINICEHHDNCGNFNTTIEYYNKTTCEFKNNTLCNCFKESLLKKCNYEKNYENNIENLIFYINFITLVNILTGFFINGIFYGYYRTKISKKYNILHNKYYDFYIHFTPILHQLALCQEYNTIYRLEESIVYPTHTM